jgi:hypothetical protein
LIETSLDLNTFGEAEGLWSGGGGIDADLYVLEAVKLRDARFAWLWSRGKAQTVTPRRYIMKKRGRKLVIWKM